MKQQSQRHTVRRKAFFTVIIIMFYLIGRNIPLYKIDIDAYSAVLEDLDNMILSTIGGDSSHYSLFALGITPFVWGTMLTSIQSAIRSRGTKRRVSPKQEERVRYIAAFGLAVLLAMIRSDQLRVLEEAASDQRVRLINACLMVIGAMIVMLLCEWNKEHGFGGQTILIVINIGGSLFRLLYGAEFQALRIPLIMTAIVVIVEIIMDNVVIHIPLMRISIHNTNAENNYLPIRLNPAGLMPVIFASVVFLIPQMLLLGLLALFPYSDWIYHAVTNMVMTKPLGFVVFILIIYLLTFLFSYLFLRPDELVENFQKTGDCIEGVHAGEETKRFLYRRLYTMCFISATIMSLCVGIPMVLRLSAGEGAIYYSLPMTCMILSSMIGTLVREFLSARSFDRYRSFL